MTIRLTLLIAGCAAALLAGSAKKSQDLEGVAPGQAVQVIVQYRNQPSQADVDHLAAKGGKIKWSHPSVRGISLTIPAASLDDVAADPNVTYVSVDRPLRSTMDYTVPTTGANLALSYGYDGNGVTVAVLDSGIAHHADLGGGSKDGSRVVYSESFLPGAKGKGTNDLYGHGTHVAGIVAGNGSVSGGALRGIAPKARLVDLQVLDENGVGTDSAVIQALERAIELKDVYGIRIVNLSLGRPIVESYTRDPLCQAVEAAWKAGLTVVVAAGNSGRSGLPGSGGYWTDR